MTEAEIREVAMNLEPAILGGYDVMYKLNVVSVISVKVHMALLVKHVMNNTEKINQLTTKINRLATLRPSSRREIEGVKCKANSNLGNYLTKAMRIELLIYQNVFLKIGDTSMYSILLEAWNEIMATMLDEFEGYTSREMMNDQSYLTLCNYSKVVHDRLKSLGDLIHETYEIQGA